MSNEINVIGMKEYLKKLGKFLFWNFLSAAILGGSLVLYGMAIEIARPSEESARGSRTSLCILWAGTNFNQRSFIGGNLLWYTGPGDYTGNYSLRSLVLYKTIQDVVQTFKQETETAFSFIWLDSRYCLLGCGTLLLESVSSDTSMDLRFYIRCAAVILVCW